jgi:hypothetical protein
LSMKSRNLGQLGTHSFAWTQVMGPDSALGEHALWQVCPWNLSRSSPQGSESLGTPDGPGLGCNLGSLSD